MIINILDPSELEMIIMQFLNLLMLTQQQRAAIITYINPCVNLICCHPTYVDAPLLLLPVLSCNVVIASNAQVQGRDVATFCLSKRTLVINRFLNINTLIARTIKLRAFD